MNLDGSSFVPIQQRLNQQKVLADSDQKSTTSRIWNDMQGWIEQRQREWDDEMTQLKSEFFSIKPDKLTSRRSSDASSLPEKMSTSSSSRVYETGRGSRMFCLTFDVSQFEPDEVNIRTQENSLIVQAKHVEQRENKSVSREFNRRVDIPPNINPDTLRCFIRGDGTLQVEAELPTPSYASSSVNRDSPLENSSTFSDRLSDRDICSPPRTEDRDMCSTPGTDRDACSPPAMHRDIYSPPRLYKDDYNPQRHSRDVLNPTRRNTDIHTRAMDSHCTNHFPPRDDRNSYNYQNTGDNIYPPQTTDSHHQTAKNNYGTTKIDSDIYNSHGTLSRDSWLASKTASDNRTTLYDNSMSVGNHHRSYSPDVVARTDQTSPLLTTVNGHADFSGIFSVVVDIGTDFEPHELAVQAVDRKLVVHAQHTDPNFRYGGDIYREFDLPEGVDPGSITANLTPEGNLFIEAPTNNIHVPYLAEPRNLPYHHHV